MTETGKIRRYFPGGNTAYGFTSLWNTNISDLERLIILKGGPGTGKSTMMRKIGEEIRKKGYGIEHLVCSSDPDSLDGMIARQRGAGIVDGTAPHMMDPKYPIVKEKIVNLADCLSEKKLQEHKEELVRLVDLNSELFRQAYENFYAAKAFYEEMKNYYGEGLDVQALDQMTKELIKHLLGEEKKKETGKERHRFAAASTPEGIICFGEEIFGGQENKYKIQGRPGTGKSVMIQKIGTAALQKGWDVVFYHNHFDPNEMDGIVIEKLNLAVFDSEVYQEKVFCSKDQIIDTFLSVSKRTYNDNKEKIEEAEKEYHKKREAGLEKLKEAKEVHDRLEKYYVDAMDFAKAEKIEDAVLKEMLG